MDNKLKPEGYSIKRLLTFEEILNLLYDFDNVSVPALLESVPDLYDFADKLYRKAYVYVAVTNDQAVLGFIAFYANDFINYTAFATLIAVVPEARGRKIADVLLSACIETAKKNNMKELKVEVRNDNIASNRFFGKNGFEFCGEASPNSIFLKKSL